MFFLWKDNSSSADSVSYKHVTENKGSCYQAGSDAHKENMKSLRIRQRSTKLSVLSFTKVTAKCEHINSIYRDVAAFLIS